MVINKFSSDKVKENDSEKNDDIETRDYLYGIPIIFRFFFFNFFKMAVSFRKILKVKNGKPANKLKINHYP